jgi:hypothetical protein
MCVRCQGVFCIFCFASTCTYEHQRTCTQSNAFGLQSAVTLTLRVTCQARHVLSALHDNNTTIMGDIFCSALGFVFCFAFLSVTPGVEATAKCLLNRCQCSPQYVWCAASGDGSPVFSELERRHVVGLSLAPQQVNWMYLGCTNFPKLRNILLLAHTSEWKEKCPILTSCPSVAVTCRYVIFNFI